jgi:hypothetical protein
MNGASLRTHRPCVAALSQRRLCALLRFEAR